MPIIGRLRPNVSQVWCLGPITIRGGRLRPIIMRIGCLRPIILEFIRITRKFEDDKTFLDHLLHFEQEIQKLKGVYFDKQVTNQLLREAIEICEKSSNEPQESQITEIKCEVDPGEYDCLETDTTDNLPRDSNGTSIPKGSRLRRSKKAKSTILFANKKPRKNKENLIQTDDEIKDKSNSVLAESDFSLIIQPQKLECSDRVKQKSTLKQKRRRKLHDKCMSVSRSTNAESRIYTCEQCVTRPTFPSKFSYRKHQMTHDKTESGNYVCRYCQKTIVDRLSYKNHLKIHDNLLKYRCEICKKSFSSKSSLTSHRNTHKEIKPYVCEICGHGSISSNALKRHQAVHAGVEHPYHCSICNKNLSCKSSLDQHKLTHTKEKMYSCEYCGKCFSSKAYADVHLRKLHTGENLFACQFCGKTFGRRNLRDMHENTHTGQNLFECHVCNKKFPNKGGYTKHMFSHGGVRPFKCDQCETRFIHRCDMERHKKAVHLGERPELCNLCGKGMVNKSKLSRHMRQVHKLDAKKGNVSEVNSQDIATKSSDVIGISTCLTNQNI